MVSFTIFFSFLYCGLYIVSYFLEDDKRKLIKYWAADYMEEIGIIGRTMNIAYALYSLVSILDKFFLRRFESQGKLEYMVDMELMKDPSRKDLNDEDRKELILKMDRYLTLVKIVFRSVCLSNVVYDVIGFSIFVYKVGYLLEKDFDSTNVQPSLMNYSAIIACTLATLRFILVQFPIEYVVRHFFGVAFSFVVTTDYFHGRIDGLERQISQFMTEIEKKVNYDETCIAKISINDSRENNQLKDILSNYDQLQTEFKRRNFCLRVLLRNMVYFIAVGLTITFSMVFFGHSLWLKLFQMITFSGWTVCFLFSTLYVGHLNSRLFVLYSSLNSLAVRFKILTKESLKMKRRLINAIKELGSNEINGQFVMGLTDGEGAATSTLEIVKLTCETITNSLMVLNFVFTHDIIMT